MDSLQLLETALKLHSQQQAFAWVTVLHVQAPASTRPGDKALVLADGTFHGWVGVGCAQPAIIKAVRMALLDGQARSIRIAPSQESSEHTLDDDLEFDINCHSGGTLKLFIDPILPLEKLVILGDSPVARSLVALAPRVGFNVTLVAQDVQAQAFPDVHQVITTDDVAAVVQSLGRASWVVVATQGRRDMQALKAALSLQAQSIWFVASARKADVLKENLRASGEDPAQVGNIIAPAGELVQGCTPEEIALSVLTAVVMHRRAPVTLAETLAMPAKKPCCGG